MHLLLYLQPSAILIAVIACFFLIMAFLRGRRIPECSCCGAMKARMSRPSGVLESLGALFLVRPYRCSGCRERFYVLRLSGGWHPYAPRCVRSTRALKIVYQLRHGIPTRVALSRVRNSDSISDSSAMLRT